MKKIFFFLSRRTLRASGHSGLPLWQDHIFISLARSASDVLNYFCILEDRAVEVGAQDNFFASTIWSTLRWVALKVWFKRRVHGSD